jgi:type 1 glutamine amidotransferase
MAAQRIVALVGDFYHAAESMRDTLARAAGAAGVDLRTFTDPADLPWESLGTYRGLIIAKENRIAPKESNAVWAEPKHESAIADFAEAGGAVIGLHNGLASFDMEGAYFRTVRGAFQYHPKEHPRFQVRTLPVEHPVLRGFKSFELMDEMYFVRVDSARTTRLLEVAHPDYGTSCAAWAHDVGKGRVFCFTPGHRTEVLNDPGFTLILENGLRWALRMEKT